MRYPAGMETARPVNFAVPASDDADRVGTDAGCTPKQELFAQEWARTGNKAAAYRLVYQPGERTAPGTIWSAASRLAALPQVVKRHRELVEAAALETIMSVRELLQLEIDIATADPNEIAYTAKRACRHCYGHEHRYQWKDDAEYIKACVDALDSGKQPPTDEGGYGYTRALDPIATCPHCLGNGVAEVVVNDTTKLTGKARKLYKGMDYKNGEWVVTMHDQDKARERIGRILGAFNDKLQLTPPGGRAPQTIPDTVQSEQEAARAYLALIG